jgi:small subunit ribosomal protein S5
MSEETKKAESKEEVKAEAAAPKEAAVEAKAEGKKEDKKGRRKPAPRKPKPQIESEFEERVVAVNRVAKVVKGGRRFSFSALLIDGDKKGRGGYGLGKAKEVPEAIRKATQAAQKNLVVVPIAGGTIPHRILGEFDAGKILFRPASEGTGVKAAGACRAIMELAGVRNVLTKSTRANNPHNVVKATFAALRKLRSAEQVAAIRGKEATSIRIK